MTAGSDQAIAVARTREELARQLATLRQRGGTIALVPTMGALHDGHRSPIRRAGELASATVVSIFVNPLQFGPSEDLDRYPRTLDADLAICDAEGVAAVFAPTTSEMYRHPPLVTIDPGPIANVLEGATRAGHFAGVLTVVAKLFHLVQPDVAVFGQKDAQQLALITRMVADLDMPVQVVATPTVRDPDGLAMSSRNHYLTADQRGTARALARALRAGAAQAPAGAAAVRQQARQVLAAAEDAKPPLRLDYLALVDPTTFTEVGAEHRGCAVLAVAAYIGDTRLIDNQVVDL